MIISFDLTGILLLIILPPIIVFLCSTAYELRYTLKNHSFNRILERNVELQKEILDLRTKIRELDDD